MLKSGDILLARYRIVKLIARGGMGAVYEVRDERLKRSIALKETLISELDLPEAFLHEATLLANLSHPVLPKVFDHFAEGDGQYITMEYIPGDDLATLLQKRGKPFSESEVASWYNQLLDALEYLHAHTILHRDLKPANLKVKGNGGIILLDFGLAKGSAGHMSQHASHKSILGYTPVYAPLEQIRCEGTSASSDLYSLGATMYHLLTNTPPVDAQKRELGLLKTGHDPLRPLVEVRPDLSPRLAELLTQAMELESHKRPVSAAAMIVPQPHRPGQSARPSGLPDRGIDESEQPTVRVTEPVPRDDTSALPSGLPTQPVVPANLTAAEPFIPLASKSFLTKPVKLGLAISTAIVLMLVTWFAISRIAAKRANLAATPAGATFPLTAENQSLYGGIEIGAKGIKAVVLKVDSSKDGYEATTLKPMEAVNTTLMSGVAQTGKFSPEAIDETAKAVKTLYTEMQNKYRVATERIYIIGSSGLQKPGQYNSDVDNKDELVRKIEGATGRKMIFIDVDQEARDSIKETIPDEYLETAILVDIGSGNTKGGYHEGDFVPMNIPYGTVTFTDEVMKRGGTGNNFAPEAVKLRSELLVPALQNQVQRKAPLVRRGRVYLTGGIVWVMTTLLHPGSHDTYVKITADDINKFEKMALDKDPGLKKPDVSSIKDPKSLKVIQDAAGKFGPENLIAGAELLQAVSSEFELVNKDIYFRDTSEWGWLFTYVKLEAAEQKPGQGQ
jgi:serine/threonine protein kinase